MYGSGCTLVKFRRENNCGGLESDSTMFVIAIVLPSPPSFREFDKRRDVVNDVGFTPCVRRKRKRCGRSVQASKSVSQRAQAARKIRREEPVPQNHIPTGVVELW